MFGLPSRRGPQLRFCQTTADHGRYAGLHPLVEMVTDSGNGSGEGGSNQERFESGVDRLTVQLAYYTFT